MSCQDVNLFIRYFLSTGLLRLSQKCHSLYSSRPYVGRFIYHSFVLFFSTLLLARLSVFHRPS